MKRRVLKKQMKRVFNSELPVVFKLSAMHHLIKLSSRSSWFQFMDHPYARFERFSTSLHKDHVTVSEQDQVKERYSPDVMKEQLEKIKKESDYRAKVDIAVDTLILVYKEQDRLRTHSYNDPHIANLSCEGYKQAMADIFQFGLDEEKRVFDALELKDSKKRTWLCEMAKEKWATTWPSFISTAKWQWKRVSAYGKFWDIHEI